jgi:hypothetical protein
MVEQRDFSDTRSITSRAVTNQPHLTQEPGSQAAVSASIEESPIPKDTGPCFYAGRRVAEIYELLELCLLELPIKDLLLAQRVNRRFNSVINTSPRLREKLFFTSRLAFGHAFKAKLNPLIVRKDVMKALPLYFDHKEKLLASSYQEGYTRLHCRSITATTVWVYLEFSDQPAGLACEENRYQPKRALERGSWEQMFVCQPSCFVSWRVQLSGVFEQQGPKHVQEVYSGIVKGAKTMGSLLDGLAESLVVQR